MRRQTVAKENFTTGIIPSAPWRVLEVELLGNYRLSVKFIDGLVGIVDINDLVHSKSAGVFSVLQDHELFQRVFVEDGVVTWPGELDLAPDAMHAEIKKNGQWVLT